MNPGAERRDSARTQEPAPTGNGTAEDGASTASQTLPSSVLRRSLASSPGAEEACPDPEILAAYSERSLDADETARFELHFSHCARCREQLAAMVRSGELVG